MINVVVGGVTLPCPSGPSDDNWASKLVALQQALAAAVAPLTWSAVSYGTGWTSAGAALQSAKDSQGRVWLRGTAQHAGDPTGLAAGTLISGRRPLTVPAYFLCAIPGSAASPVFVEVSTSGNIIIIGAGGLTGVSIDFGQVFFDTQAF